MPSLGDLETPAALVDLERVAGNLDRMAAYTRQHGLALRPHIKTHKTPALALEQLRRGAVGVTCATAREAEVMATVAEDILVAYPTVDPARMRRLLALPATVRLTVALDSAEALRRIAEASAARAASPVGVLVELDLGMHRVGLATPEEAVALAGAVTQTAGVEYRGVMFYPGHIRERTEAQEASLLRLASDLERFLGALAAAGLGPEVVSGGSTPAGWSSHRLPGLTEIRPGTYIFNDRTTAAIGACHWDDCAYTVLATVVSTAVPGQAVVDAGAKSLAREEIRGLDLSGYGAVLDHPEVPVAGISEEHGIMDLSASKWQPRVGDRVRIVPNHVCVSVNLQERLWGFRGDDVAESWDVAARGH